MKEIEIKVASKEATKAEQDLYDVAEIVKEMYLRKQIITFHGNQDRI